MLEKIKSRIGGKMGRNFVVAVRNLLSGQFDGYTDFTPIISFILGCRVGDAFTESQRQWIYKDLLKKYSHGDHFRFGSLCLPRADESKPAYIAQFIHDFLDIVYPALSGHGSYLGDGPYEYGNIKVAKGDVVIDAGANIGMFAAVAASRGAAVYAFEPVAAVRESYLERTVTLNGNIHIVPMALSDKDGSAEINLEQDNLVSSSLVISRTGNVEQIQTITLDSFVEQNNIPRVDFIKADIEGAERLLLAGAQNVLRQHGPKLAVCTYHLPDDKEALTALILKANPGYKINYKWHKLYAET